jgi:hypothetical protein
LEWGSWWRPIRAWMCLLVSWLYCIAWNESNRFCHRQVLEKSFLRLKVIDNRKFRLIVLLEGKKDLGSLRQPAVGMTLKSKTLLQGATTCSSNPWALV